MLKFIDAVLLPTYLPNILQAKNINNILINKDPTYAEQMCITHQYKRYTLFILIKKDSDIQDVTLVHELFSYDVHFKIVDE